MTEHATAMGAEIAHMVIGIALLIACHKIGQWVTHRTRRMLLGWAAGLAVFAAVGFIVAPLLSSLNVAKCSGDRYPELCESGTYGPDY